MRTSGVGGKKIRHFVDVISGSPLDPTNIPTVAQSDILAHHVRGHDHGVDAEFNQPRHKLGKGGDRGPPEGKLVLPFQPRQFVSRFPRSLCAVQDSANSRLREITEFT